VSYLSASEVMIHEEALYQVYVPLSLLTQGINFGRMPFMSPPMTHTSSSGAEPRFAQPLSHG